MTSVADHLSLDEVCRLAGVTPRWVQRHVRDGLLPAVGDAAPAWRFDVVVLHRIRVMRRLERDFDAVPELAALVADLHDEIERLRSQLRRAGMR